MVTLVECVGFGPAGVVSGISVVGHVLGVVGWNCWWGGSEKVAAMTVGEGLQNCGGSDRDGFGE